MVNFTKSGHSETQAPKSNTPFPKAWAILVASKDLTRHGAITTTCAMIP